MKKLLTILCLVLLSSCSQEPPLLLIRDGITYDQNTNEPFTGIVEEFHENGQLEQRTTYRDGEEVVQTRLTYRENGQLEYRTNYRAGEQDGLWEGAVDQSPLMQPQQIFTADQRGVISGCL